MAKWDHDDLRSKADTVYPIAPREELVTRDGSLGATGPRQLTAREELEARAAAITKGGHKDDQGKDAWHLLPWDAIRGIVKVLTFGAKKYAPRNWEVGMDWSRPYAALIRHLSAWWERDAGDADTGYSHLWHAGCCLIFLIAYEIRGVGRDDRPEP